ncbi:MAG: thiolase family protein [candidate division NC10 bacterium]|nr:thiolase family protein [candidate division NC10 bacterium]
MDEPVIVSAVRTAVGKAPRGSLRHSRPDEMAAAAIRAAIARVPGLKPEAVDDLILGCAMPEAEQGLNVARQAGLRAGLPVSVPACTINRFCASGLQAIAFAAERIQTGAAEVVVAGGTESMSLVPMGGFKVAPNPALVAEYPDVYLSVGLTAEVVAAKCGVSREDQDRFALESHRRAVAAQREGRFAEEIIPLPVPVGKGAPPLLFDRDEGPRPDTSLEALGKLPPAFQKDGTVTAGNTSQMSDGAAAVVVMARRRAEALKAKVLARFLGYAVAGLLPEEMGLGPAYAVPKVLRQTGLRQGQVDLIELNEAFAAQVLGVMRMLDLDPAKVNVNGGAIALGHPLGCTGAKLTATLLYELERRGGRIGLVTMCVGGGMGAAGLFARDGERSTP